MIKAKLRKDLLVSELEQELVVLNLTTNQAHSLDGKASESFLRLRQHGELEETPSNLYFLSLLNDCGLLLEPKAITETAFSRRQALSALGKAALLPAILTVGLPQPTAAQSAGVSEADCIAGLGCGSPCIGVIGTRVCGAVSGSADTSCACVPVAVAVCPCT